MCFVLQGYKEMLILPLQCPDKWIHQGDCLVIWFVRLLYHKAVGLKTPAMMCMVLHEICENRFFNICFVSYLWISSFFHSDKYIMLVFRKIRRKRYMTLRKSRHSETLPLISVIRFWLNIITLLWQSLLKKRRKVEVEMRRIMKAFMTFSYHTSNRTQHI